MPPRATSGPRSVATLVVGLWWLVAVAGAAGHDGVPDLSVAPTTVGAGGAVTLAGDDFTTGDALVFVLVGNGARVQVGDEVVGRNGHFPTDVVVPEGTADGAYVIEADRGTEPLASVGLTISAASGVGSEVALVIVVAAVAGVGAGLYLARRSRARATIEEATEA
jgi:hypothetical protein